MQLFDDLLCVEAALFHALQRRGKGENSLLHRHGSFSVKCDGCGLEPGELLFDFLQLCCGDGHDGSPVFRRGHAPDWRFVFPVERDGRPRFTK